LPLTEEIRFQIFGSPDLSVFLIDHLSDGDSVHSSETLFEILRNPVNTCFICAGTPVKTCWKFGSHNYFKSDLLHPWPFSKEILTRDEKGAILRRDSQKSAP